MDQLIVCWVHKQAVMSQKIDTDDGELDISEKKSPGEPPAAEAQRHGLLTPTLDGQSVGTIQTGA